MKICVFGGTFDPLHLGHENIIHKLLKRFSKLIIVPSKQSPGKNSYPLANEFDRLKMISLCDFTKNSNCIISDYELRSNKQPSYTIDTIRYIRNKFKDTDIYLAIGLDQLNNLNTWYKIDALLQIVKLICFNRSCLIKSKEASSIDYELIKDFNYNISSSKIRDYILNNDKRAKDMINEKIFNYIMEEKIYR